ncbi:MAG: sodium:solute symporter family transporter, partial [Planctomycetota bacterium]
TASVFTNDLYKRWMKPASSETHLVRVARIVGFITLLLAYPLALSVTKYKYIFTYSQNAWCILAIPIMLVFTYGVLWRRATNKAAIATFIFIAPFVAAPFIWGSMEDNYLTLPLGGYRIHLFNFAFVLWVVAGVFMFAVSLMTRPPDQARIRPFVWSWAIAKLHYLEGRELQWYQRVGLWALVAGGMYVVIYIKFW